MIALPLVFIRAHRGPVCCDSGHRSADLGCIHAPIAVLMVLWNALRLALAPVALVGFAAAMVVVGVLMVPRWIWRAGRWLWWAGAATAENRAPAGPSGLLRPTLAPHGPSLMVKIQRMVPSRRTGVDV
jgi:hypothetical protein